MFRIKHRLLHIDTKLITSESKPRSIGGQQVYMKSPRRLKCTLHWITHSDNGHKIGAFKIILMMTSGELGQPIVRGIVRGITQVASVTFWITHYCRSFLITGCQSHLLEYETSRQRNIIPVVAAIDSLKRLYSTDNPAVVIARSLGLQATNALEPLKQQIISLATGRWLKVECQRV